MKTVDIFMFSWDNSVSVRSEITENAGFLECDLLGWIVPDLLKYYGVFIFEDKAFLRLKNHCASFFSGMVYGMILWNASDHLPSNTVLHPVRLKSSVLLFVCNLVLYNGAQIVLPKIK